MENSLSLPVFSKEEVNVKRQFEYDVAKAFAIVFMILVHTVDQITAGEGALYCAIEFFGCAPSACVFMMSMGLGIVFTRHRSPRDFLLRGAKLLIAAYLLNFFRETLLLILGNALNVENDYQGVSLYASLMAVDILHFAGLSFLFVALCERLKLKNWAVLLIAIAFSGISNLCLGAFGGLSEYAQYPLGLLFYVNSETCFPFFAWFIYPAIGMCLGSLLRHVNDKNRFYACMFALGASSLFLVSSGCAAINIDIAGLFMTTKYYMQDFVTLMWCLSLVFTLLPLYYWLSLAVRGKAKDGVEYLSANVNLIYIVQWLVICYFIAVLEIFDVGPFPTWAGAEIGVLIMAACLLISIGVNKIKQSVKKAKSHE